MYLALNVMNLIWAFDISLLKDPDTGLPILLDDSDDVQDVRVLLLIRLSNCHIFDVPS